MKQVQSYLSVFMYGHFSIYETRIFLKIVQRAQGIIKAQGTKYSDFIDKAYRMDGYNVNFAVPIMEIVGEKCHNTLPLKNAIVNMERNWIVQHYDVEKKQWFATPIIYNARIEEKSGILRFSVADWIVYYIADFGKYGYREYDFEVAMYLRNPAAARLYMLTCSMTSPLTYNIENIKNWLGMADKYKRNSDFLRKVIEPARIALDKAGVNGFKYEIEKERKGRATAAISKIKFIPVKRADKMKDASQVRAEIETLLPANLVNYLYTQVGMKASEIYRVKDDWLAFTGNKDWQWKLTDIIERARKGRKNHGWIISAIRSENERQDKKHG